MEIDFIRSVGKNTSVSLWIDGKLRGIIVSPLAIQAWLSSEEPISDEECCQFVRSNLRLIQRAAKDQLARQNPFADAVFVETLGNLALASCQR